uniref:3-oxoacyl-ACP synthase n=1 Tax=Globodera pallida TaxID=36090 RepID=A0A183CTL9_GLOPA
ALDLAELRRFALFDTGMATCSVRRQGHWRGT